MRLRERISDPNVFRVYGATFALGLAYGVAISLIAIFLDARGFGKTAIGQLAAWFASGIVVMALPMGGLIRRWSAKWVLASCLAGYATCVGVFPFLNSYAAVAFVRFFDGAFSVGVWVSCETILLARSDSHHKAFVMSLYAIALAFGYVIGPVAARLLVGVAPMWAAFVVAAGIALGASAYVIASIERDRAPSSLEPNRPAHSGFVAVLSRIKTSCFATFCYGYFQASVVLFLPLFLIESKGIARDRTILIPAFFAAGMLLFSNIAGRIGDRVGHLVTMRALGSVGTLMILGFVLFDSYPLMCAAVFVAGASLASISPVSLALQGVVSEPSDYGRATAIYNAFYAAGMLIGPPTSSRIFAVTGGAAMLYQLAALWAAFVAFTIAFRRDDPAALRHLRAVEAITSSAPKSAALS